MRTSKLIGIPYLYGGATFEGCDCWGLVVLAYKELGATLPDLSGFYQQCPDHRLINLETGYRELEQVGGFERVELLEPYTIILGVLPKSFLFGLWMPEGAILRTFKGGRSGLVDWDWVDQFEETRLYRYQN